ncbi:MAG TPA: Asp-tRNA(Asn)/Glu-tRNA(Gln) amidotransferase subunit GatA [Solirubrobacterales bacterium]|nr:Asp-tRNA(Asn)/Glu-tRNA(Gln) amidotransferase subunit GatA [Solirubrobacterales bacterium]
MSDLLDLTVAEAAAKIAAGEVSTGEYVAAWRAAAATDDLNAYLWNPPEPTKPPGEWSDDPAAILYGDAGPRAGQLRPQTPYNAGDLASSGSGPLAGVPIAIKDIFTIEGRPTTAGSRILEGYEPPYTATAVRKLAEAGGLILGKTNMDEFAMGSSNENSGYGPVLNPWDRGRVPGGSSGGSAAVVAGGLAPAALGTDTGGSIRQPAALCGIVGLKPTYGAISRFGMIAFASSLDQCGPLTRDVADAALLLGALQGKDPLDSTSVGIQAGIALPTREDLKGLRFGVPKEIAEAPLDAGVRRVFEATVARIEELGGEIVEIALPHAEHGISAYYVIAPAEASSNLARYDGVRYGKRAGGDGDLIEMYETTRSEGFGAEVKRRIMLGTYALSSGYYDAYYGQAQKVRTRIAGDFDAAFAVVDFVITPTSPSVAFELGSKTADPLAMYLNDFFTVPMSLAGIPAISIPAGLAQPSGGGPELPVGFQIAAPAFGERKLLDAAYALEQGIGFEGPTRGGAEWLSSRP